MTLKIAMRKILSTIIKYRLLLLLLLPPITAFKKATVENVTGVHMLGIFHGERDSQSAPLIHSEAGAGPSSSHALEV